MRILFFSIITSTIFSQALISSETITNQLKIALENASRTGQVIWAEEFSGLT